MSIDDSIKSLRDMLKDSSEINKYIEFPRLNCLNSAQAVIKILKDNGVKFKCGAMATFTSSLVNQGNHYLVIATHNDYEVYIDITSRQFDMSSDGPIYASGRDWRKKFIELNDIRNKVVLFAVFDNTNDAEHWLTKGRKLPSLFDKGEILNFKDSITSNPDKNLRMLINEGVGIVETNPEKAMRFFKNQLFNDKDKVRDDIKTKKYSQEDLYKAIEKAQGKDVSVTESFKEVKKSITPHEKMMANIAALMAIEKSPEKSAYKNVSKYLFRSLIPLSENVITGLKSSVLPVGESALYIKSVMDNAAGWETITTKDIKESVIREFDTGDAKYAKRFIIQLEPDDISTAAAKNIFKKDIMHNTLIQYRDKAITSGLRWDAGLKLLVSGPISMTLGTEGVLNITLVGHGRNNGTEFGGLKPDNIKKFFSAFSSAFNDSKVQKIKLDFVGCELIPTGDFPKSLVYQVMEWFRLQITPEKLIAIGSQYPVRVTESGKKQYLISGTGWVDNNNAILSGFMYKNAITWSNTTQTWDVGYPDKYFDKLLSFTQKELQGGRISTNTTGNVSLTEKLTSEQLKLIDLANNYNATVRKLRISDNWNTFGDIEGNSLKFFDGEGRGILIGLESQDIDTIRLFKNKINAYADQVRKEFTISPNGRVLTRINTGTQISGSVLNAVFFTKTLLDGGLWGNNDKEVKALLFSCLGAQSIGMVADTALLVKYISDAKKLSWIGNETLGVLQKSGLAAGAFVDALGLVLSINALVNNKDKDIIPELATNLAINIASAGMTTTAIIATTLGASAVATAVGVLTIPFAAVGIGLNKLMTTVTDNKKRLHTLESAIQRYSVDPDHLFLSNGYFTSLINDNTCIVSVDFKTRRVSLGNIMLSPTEPAAGHTRIRDWWNHIATGGTRFGTDTALFLDFYEGICIQKNIFAPHLSAKKFILPATPHTNLSFEYDYGSGLRWENPVIFKKLNKKYGERFIWGFFSGGRDRVISKVIPKQLPTTINVLLDKEERELTVPIKLDNATATLLKYSIQNGGGDCTIDIPRGPVCFSLTDPEAVGGKWHLRFTAEHLEDGDYKKLGDVFNSFITTATPVSSLALTSGTKVEFAGGDKRVELSVRLSENVTLNLLSVPSVTPVIRVKLNSYTSLHGDMSDYLREKIAQFNLIGVKSIIIAMAGQDIGQYNVEGKELNIGMGEVVYSDATVKLSLAHVNKDTGQHLYIKTKPDNSSPKGIVLPERIDVIDSRAGTLTATGKVVSKYTITRSGGIELFSSIRYSDVRIWTNINKPLFFRRSGEQVFLFSSNSVVYGVTSNRDDTNLVWMADGSSGRELQQREILSVGGDYIFPINKKIVGGKISLPFRYSPSSGKVGYLVDVDLLITDVTNLGVKGVSEICTEDLISILNKYTILGINYKHIYQAYIIFIKNAKKWPFGRAIEYDLLKGRMKTDLGFIFGKMSTNYASNEVVVNRSMSIIDLPNQLKAKYGDISGNSIVSGGPVFSVDDDWFYSKEKKPVSVRELISLLSGRVKRSADTMQPEGITYEFLKAFGDEYLYSELTNSGLLVYGRNGIVYDWSSKKAIGVNSATVGIVKFKEGIKSDQFTIDKMLRFYAYGREMIVAGESGILYKFNQEGDIFLFGREMNGLQFKFNLRGAVRLKDDRSIKLDPDVQVFNAPDGYHYLYSKSTRRIYYVGVLNSTVDIKLINGEQGYAVDKLVVLDGKVFLSTWGGLSMVRMELLGGQMFIRGINALSMAIFYGMPISSLADLDALMRERIAPHWGYFERKRDGSDYVLLTGANTINGEEINAAYRDYSGSWMFSTIKGGVYELVNGETKQTGRVINGLAVKLYLLLPMGNEWQCYLDNNLGKVYDIFIKDNQVTSVREAFFPEKISMLQFSEGLVRYYKGESMLIYGHEVDQNKISGVMDGYWTLQFKKDHELLVYPSMEAIRMNEVPLLFFGQENRLYGVKFYIDTQPHLEEIDFVKSDKPISLFPQDGQQYILGDSGLVYQRKENFWYLRGILDEGQLQLGDDQSLKLPPDMQFLAAPDGSCYLYSSSTRKIYYAGMLNSKVDIKLINGEQGYAVDKLVVLDGKVFLSTWNGLTMVRMELLMGQMILRSASAQGIARFYGVPLSTLADLDALMRERIAYHWGYFERKSDGSDYVMLTEVMTINGEEINAAYRDVGGAWMFATSGGAVYQQKDGKSALIGHLINGLVVKLG